jgi:hypothetical protein
MLSKLNWICPFKSFIGKIVWYKHKLIWMLELIHPGLLFFFFFCENQEKGVCCVVPQGRPILPILFRRNTRPARLAQTSVYWGQHAPQSAASSPSAHPPPPPSQVPALSEDPSLCPSRRDLDWFRPSLVRKPYLFSSSDWLLAFSSWDRFSSERLSLSTPACPRIQIFLSWGGCANAPPIQSPSGFMDLLAWLML